MKRLISIFILILILFAICLYEEIFLKNFTNSFTSKAESLSKEIYNNEVINTTQINNSLSELEKTWKEAKITLCFFTNYEKIKSLDECIIKLNAAIENNDKNLAYENISLISKYQQFFNYMLGFNFNNLF